MKKKKNNYGGIYLDTKSNTYYVSSTFTDMAKQRHKLAKRGFKTADEALKWKQDTQYFYKTNIVDNSGIVTTELGMYVDKYLESKSRNCKELTIMQTSSTLRNYFVNYFNKEKITNLDVISPVQINDYYSFLARLDMNERSKNITLSRILGFIDWLDLMEYISPSITRKFKKILQPFEIREKPKNDFLSIEELQKVLNTFDTSVQLDRYYRFGILFLAYTGLRKSELFGLTWNDIDFKNSRVLVNKQYQRVLNKVVPYTKTNIERYVIMPDWLADELVGFMIEFKEKDDDFIFPHRNFNGRLTEACKKASVKEVKLHDLRHTFCTMLYDNGASGKYVQSQMGHTTENTSKMVYEHLTGKMLSEGIEVINKLKKVE